GIIFIGIPSGGIAGGLLASWLIPSYGWSSLFIVGGILPIILLPVLMIFLPESPRFLSGKKDSQNKVRALAEKIESKLTITTDTSFTVEDSFEKNHFPVSELFQQGRTRDSLLLWLAFFSNLMVIYFLYSWIPTLLVDAGYGLTNATRTTVIMNIGGAIGPLILAWFVVRKGSRKVLTFCFLAGASSLIFIGQAASSLMLIMLGSFFAGAFIIGGQVSLNALASFIYPTHIRSTGVGWALGIGRIGSIMGPILAGQLILLNLGMANYFFVFGLVLFVTSLSTLLIRNQQQATGKAGNSSN
ncbi:MAG: MFS transporter, partial [Gammaproteobacteria bacterium]